MIIRKSCKLEKGRFRVLNRLQHLLSQTDQTDHLSDVILSYAIQAEKVCPTSSDYFLDMIQNEKIYTDDTGHQIKNKFDLLKIGNSLVENQQVKDIFSFLVENIEKDTQIKVEKHDIENFVVEIKEACARFQLNKLTGHDQAEYTFTNSYIATIDGHIETVASIDKLLSQIVQQQEHVVIFCRGASEEVIHTINKNNEKSIFSISVFSVPFDVRTVNNLADISVLSGSRLISSHSGDLISSVDLSACGKIEKSYEKQDEIRIYAYHEKLDVINSHISYLKDKLRQVPEEVANILSERIDQISSKSITIKIPNKNPLYSERVMPEIDLIVRFIISAICGNFKPVEVANQFYKKVINLKENSVSFEK